MRCKWNPGDVLELTQDCELGAYKERCVVLSVEGDRYMTLVFPDRAVSARKVYTGADYKFLQLNNARRD